MTDKEKIELKDGVISIFKRFNILDHTATIGGLRDDILRYIDSLQEEPELSHSEVTKISDQEEPVSIWHDSSEEPNDMSHCLIFYGCKESVGHYLHYEPVLYNKKEKMFVTSSFPHPTGYKVEQKSLDGGCVAEVHKNKRDRISISDITQWCYLYDLHNLTQKKEPVSEGRDIFDNCLKSEEKFILPQKISGNINCENCLYSSACALGDIQACIIDKPVSEELEEAAKRYATEGDEISGLYIIDVEVDAFKAGAEWKKNHLWKDAQGDDLPEIDREVVVLVQDYPDDKDHLRVAFAHRPNKYAKVWNYNFGEEQTIEIERHGKGGWNIPNVKYWLDVVFPKEMEE